MDTDLVDRLVRHGLGQGEARCYVAMLAPRAFKVSEVVVRAGLPRPRAYELIRSLVRAGLCTEAVGAGAGVARFRAVPPNEAIGRLEAFAAERTRRHSAALASLLQAFHARHGSAGGISQERVELLRRREQVLGAYQRAFAAARDEVLMVVAQPWDPVDSPAALARLATGLRIRALHDPGACHSARHREYLGYYTRHGVDVRIGTLTGVLCSVFDRDLVILHLTAPGEGRAGPRGESLLLRHDGLAGVLADVLDSLWARSTPFEQALRDLGLPLPEGTWPGPLAGPAGVAAAAAPLVIDGRSVPQVDDTG